MSRFFGFGGGFCNNTHKISRSGTLSETGEVALVRRLQGVREGLVSKGWELVASDEAVREMAQLSVPAAWGGYGGNFGVRASHACLSSSSIWCCLEDHARCRRGLCRRSRGGTGREVSAENEEAPRVLAGGTTLDGSKGCWCLFELSCPPACSCSVEG